MTFKPCFEKFSGQRCSGVMVHVTDPLLFRPVATYLTLLSLARAQAPDKFAFRTEPYEFEAEKPAFDLLTGSDAARQAMTAGAAPEAVVSLIAAVDPVWQEFVLEAESRLIRARA
jgi:uncharacterized protein YbbC (DUF1343 family)